MKSYIKSHFKRAVGGLVIFSMLAQPLAAVAAPLVLAPSPLFVGASIPPMVMLDISKDQQLYKKAYTDYSDIDGDGILDITYNHGIDYYGYFDSYKCYTYNASAKRYEPAVYNTKDSTTAANSTTNKTAKYCSTSGTQSTRWSGNFLNWATMTRMDAVRKLLYGGMRSANRSDGDGNGLSDGDTASGSVLERTLLPNDAHSFAKYYNGADISRLTPFTQNLVSTTSTTSRTIGAGDVTFTLASTSNFANGDIVMVASTASPTNYMSGYVKSRSSTQITLDNVDTLNTGGSGTFAAWTVTNLSMTGITICNTTVGSSSSPQDRSQTNTNLPRLRIAQGNFTLWSAMERWQCIWEEEKSGKTAATNDFRVSNVPSFANRPDRATYGLDNKSSTDGKGDYFVRVQACVTGLLGTEKCKEYNQNNVYKPIGLLQVYGETGQIQYGLMTGSYNKNISGGVLRKNIGPFNDEINADGTFIALASTGVAGGGALSSGGTMPAGGSIITTLNRMRIWGYRYDDGTYIGGGTADDCGFQLTSIAEGKCVSWGNPMSEIYYESLRYFAGKTSATSAFTTDDSGKIAGLATATWPTSATNVLSNTNYCAPPSILIFNASVSTNEADSQIGNPFTGLTFDAVTQTSAVGTNEGITGTAKFFIGRTSATGTNATTDNEYCDAKTQTGLGNMFGICPEGPTLAGSYLMSGLAYTAHTNRIRNDLTVPTSDTKALKVNTYGISLATNVPQIPITLTGGTAPKVIIQPAYRLFNSAPQGGGTLVDMQIVSQTVTATSAKGRISLNWEDSEQGGDYDQDMWGVLSYCLQSGSDTTSCPGQAANTISVTTASIAESTVGAQGFGYIISGTSQDGPHFHAGVLGFNYTDPTNITVTGGGAKVNASGGCANCQKGDPETTATFTLSSAAPGSPLKDPLWYAAKYGGFNDLDGTGLPNTTAEWDIVKADGTPGSDGNPDNYFLVSNPLGLETSLNKLFTSIIATASASAAAANSSRLTTNTKVFQAVFNTQDWSSKLLAYGVNTTTGAPNVTPDWDAGLLTLNTASVDQNSRVILTYNKGVSGAAPKGIPFRWPSNPASPTTSELAAAQITALRTNPVGGATDSTTVGQNRLLYLRGDGTNEGILTTDFRKRPITKLGDIVNSNMNYQGPPASGYADPTYASFASTNANRTPVIYVGANDGMLHAFDASSCTSGSGGCTAGNELMAYVPAELYGKLSKLTNPAYTHTYFVDGSPAVEDAFLGSASTGAWKTMLVGGLNSGGQGIYALDVTNPANFSESNAASLVKWEFTDADDADLGFTFGDPQIRKMANGKWAAIVSGGYNNTDASSGEVACTGGAGTTASPYTPAGCTVSGTGYAYLYVIFLDGPTGSNGTWVQGTDYIKISTATGSTGTPNGLASPYSVDVNGDNKVDYVYAGDLQGNLWKFDLSSATTSNWTLTNSRVNLFTAQDSGGTAQPITSRVQWALHPTGVGYIVSFGTGKYLETTDTASPFSTQTVYGIWDKANNTSNISAQSTVSGRSVLMQQLMLANGTTSAGTPYRVLSKFVPNYTSANITYTSAQVAATDPNRPANTTTVTPQLGWYFDLSNSTAYASGERNVFAPDLRNGIAIYSTLWPLTSVCLGSAGGDNLVFNIGTGARPDFSVFDTNANGLANSSDFVPVNGVNVAISSLGIAGGSGGASQTPTFIRMPGASGGTGYGLPTAGGSQNAGIQSPTGGKLSSAIYSFGQDFGRISWREIVTD